MKCITGQAVPAKRGHGAFRYPQKAARSLFIVGHAL